MAGEGVGLMQGIAEQGMALDISSERNEFAGFSEFYRAAIVPYLAGKEAERSAAVTNVLILGAATATLSLAFLLFAPIAGMRTHLALFTAMGGGAVATWLINRTRADITHGLLDLIAGKLGFSYTGKLERPPYCDHFRGLKLLPDFNIESWEDEVRGAYRGAAFTFCEAHLKRKTSNGKRTSVKTVFHGQLFIIDYPKRFPGTTVVLRDMGVFNSLTKPGKEFSRVGLASPAFEKAFEAWSTDQVEARELLDPLVLERFQELERLYGGKKIRVAFDEGKIMIATETGDRLNIGTMFKPLHGAERVETIIREFDAIFDLVDVLLKRLDGRIDGAFSVNHLKSSGTG